MPIHTYPHGPVLEPALIEELKKLQKENKNHSPTFSDEFLLSGFLYTENDEVYKGDSTTKIIASKPTKYTYYVTKTKLGQIRRLNAKALEGDVLGKLKEYLVGNEIFSRLLSSRNVQQIKLSDKYDTQLGELKNKSLDLQLELDQFSIKIRKLVLSDSDDSQDALILLRDEKNKIEREIDSLLQQDSKLREEKARACHKPCDSEFLQKFKVFFSEFERLSNCDKKMLLKALMAKIIIHSDFRIEIRVNLTFNELVEETDWESEKTVRAMKKWLGRRDSNSRPTD